MPRLVSRLRNLGRRLLRGEVGAIAARLRLLIWSEQRYLVLRRDLMRDAAPPRAPVAFTIRPFAPEDDAALFDSAVPEEAAERDKRRHWRDRGLGRCYVAALEDGRACFTQWLFTAADNALVRDIFEARLPEIASDTVLLEGAYTPPRLRRMPLMPAAMARIAEQGRGLGARWVMVCIGLEAGSMIKAAQWAGFGPYRLKIDRRRFFGNFVSYAEPPEGVVPEPAAKSRLPLSA